MDLLEQKKMFGVTIEEMLAMRKVSKMDHAMYAVSLLSDVQEVLGECQPMRPNNVIQNVEYTRQMLNRAKYFIDEQRHTNRLAADRLISLGETKLACDLYQ